MIPQEVREFYKKCRAKGIIDSDLTDVIRKYLSKVGKKGGLSTSDKKINASRNNGKLGGRPKKIKCNY